MSSRPKSVGHKRSIRSFVKRAGRLTRGQQYALEHYWSHYGIDFAPETRLDLGRLFPGFDCCKLEIGFGNGESLAFFQFADKEDQEEFGPELPMSGFRHLAMKVDQETQDGIRDRLAAAGITEPQTYILDHGYCYSLYVVDPANLIIEFTVDHEDMDAINAERKASAHADLERWLAGDHTPNNTQFNR